MSINFIKSMLAERRNRKLEEKLQKAIVLVNSTVYRDGSMLAVMKTKFIGSNQYVCGDEGAWRKLGRKA